MSSSTTVTGGGNPLNNPLVQGVLSRVLDRLLDTLLNNLDRAIEQALNRILGGNPAPTVGINVEPAPAPPAVAAPVPARVEIHLMRIRYHESIAPGHQLVDEARLREIRAGQANVNRGSHVTVTLTAYDESGQEYTPDRVRNLGLAFRTSHRATTNLGTITKDGHGVPPTLAPGAPVPSTGVDLPDDGISGGDKNWQTSMGFNHTYDLDLGYEGPVSIEGAVNGRWAANAVRFDVS